MADYFDNKDYNDYFKTLEKQINNAPKEKPADANIQKNTLPAKKSKKRRKGVFILFRLRKSVIAVFLIIVILITVIAVLSSKKSDSKSENVPVNETTKSAVSEKTDEVSKKIKYVSDSNTVSIPESNDCFSAIIIDKTTNKVTAQRKANEKAYPASTTKIMTLLVAAENISDFNDTFTMTLAITDPLFIAEASVAGFLRNETINMTDLLYGTVLPSGADAAMALAIKIAGSEEEFVKLMNKKVNDLGLKNTHFDNVTGLHSEQNYSTAYDMAVILDAALQNKLCREILSTYQYTTAKTPQHPDGILLSSTLFSYMYGTEPETATILGGKTGYVAEAGYCIASYGKANQTGKEYIIVTLGNSSRWPAFYGQIDLYKQFAK